MVFGFPQASQDVIRQQMKNLTGLFFAISLLLFACDQKKEKDNRRCRKTLWENGKIRAEGCFTGKSIKQGLFTKYFQSGQVESEINYHDNKEDGVCIGYYENGKRRFVVHYTNGVRIDAGVEYYENGAIKLYEVFNLKGVSTFKIDYLEDGSIKEGKGAPVIDYSVNKDTLNIGDVLKIDFMVATPKNSKVSFLFYEDATTKQNSQYLKVIEKENYGTVVYEKVLDKKGTMSWGGTCIVKFDDGKQKDVKFKFIGFSTVR